METSSPSTRASTRPCARREPPVGRAGARWAAPCLAALVACTGTPAPAPADVVQADAQAPVEVVQADAPAVVPPPPTPAVAAPPTLEPEVRQLAPVDAVPELPPVAAPPAEVPRFADVASVDPASVARVQPGWSLAQQFDRAVEFLPTDGGVLARLGDVLHELGPDGTLVAKPTIATAGWRSTPWDGELEVLGVWPGDAWRVRERSQEREGSLLTFMRWRGNNRWVAQNDDPNYDENEVLYRWSPRSGVLLTRRYYTGDALFERFAGKHPAPAGMPLPEGQEIEDLYESVGGTLFLFVDPQIDGPGDALEILRSCDTPTPGCERTGGVALASPVDAWFETGAMAARGRGSISAAIRATFRGATPRSYVVHHETGGWKLDAVPGDLEVSQLLAAPDGGLWIVTEGEQPLWHRSEAGRWVGVDLPERRSDHRRVHLVLRDEANVWLAVNTGDHHAIYAAPAVLQAAASAAEPNAAG